MGLLSPESGFDSQRVHLLGCSLPCGSSRTSMGSGPRSPIRPGWTSSGSSRTSMGSGPRSPIRCVPERTGSSRPPPENEVFVTPIDPINTINPTNLRERGGGAMGNHSPSPVMNNYCPIIAPGGDSLRVAMATHQGRREENGSLRAFPFFVLGPGTGTS